AGRASVVIRRRQCLRALVEPGHVHARQAVLLTDAAIERLVLGVRMDVDQAGDDEAGAAVDDPVRGAGKFASDKGDAVVLENEVDTAAVDMMAGRFVPGDQPGG